MSRVCAVSGKKAMSGNRRSHSLRATRRKWNVNLQKVHMIVDGKPQTVKISARALKTLKVLSNRRLYEKEFPEGNFFMHLLIVSLLPYLHAQ